MKKLLTVLLTAVLLLSLAACGSDGTPTDPNAGMYYCTTVKAVGVLMTVDEVYDNGAYLELKDGGKGTINLDGMSTDITWTLEDSALSVDMEGQKSSGTLSDGTIVLNLLDMDMFLTFVKEGSEASATDNTANFE